MRCGEPTTPYVTRALKGLKKGRYRGITKDKCSNWALQYNPIDTVMLDSARDHLLTYGAPGVVYACVISALEGLESRNNPQGLTS